MTRRPTVWLLTEPTIQRAGAGRYQLVTPFEARVNGLAVSVPAGFVTDGASVPALFWLLVSNPYAPSSLRAAILHDALCRSHGMGQLSSATVHAAFYVALLAEGCAPLRAWAMYQAVRWCGPRW